MTDVQDGFSYEGKIRSYDGTGVVCGMMDTGLEANHINFKNEDGTSRIKRRWHMNSNNGTAVEYTDQTIGGFTTDLTTQGHATQVAGIIGGSYKGNGKYMKMYGPAVSSGTMMDNAPIPYYGVATGADLAFSVGQLYTPNIIQGVTKIIEYAESTGQPVVVNLSLGSTSGPHDGSDAYSQALSKLGERGIICMSAGNDGDANLSITKKFSGTAAGKVLNTFISESKANGVVDIWASDSNALTVKWGIYNKDTQNTTYFIESSSSGSASSTGTDFTTFFNGSISTSANLNTSNNRYEVYNELLNVSMKSGNDSNYLVLSITGTSGQTVYVYGDSDTQFSNKYTENAGLLSGYTNGSPANSINDAACANNILSVGAYTSRIYWGRLDGSVYGYNENGGYSVGSIAPFSSYGTSFQGNKLPLVCAPGANIISSYSSYYAGSNASTTMCASVTSGANVYYWGAMQGTSMSCPYVTGTIGLWLQADPSLDYNKVLEVIEKTSISQTASADRWGAGKIDALKGIQKVLADKAASLGEVWADDEQRLIVTDLGGQLEVFVAGGEQMDVTLYDIQGRPVASAKADNGEAVINASQLQKGLYILRVAGKDFSLSRKIMR